MVRPSRAARPGPELGAPSPGIAHTMPSSVCINTAANATEWRAIEFKLDIRGLKAKVPVADEDGNYHTTEVPLIGPPIRAMVGNMLFMGAYGHKTMFKSTRTRIRHAFPQSCH